MDSGALLCMKLSSETWDEHHERSRCLPEQHRAAGPHHSGTARSPKQGIEWSRRIVRDNENLVDLLCPQRATNGDLYDSRIGNR